jgi:glycosyltransferase involved in cell wall biosynthesis
MLDLDPKLQCKTSAFEQRSHFVTIGNFRHPPNWDSTLWLKNTVWPKVREQLPTAQLHIYGAYPAKKVTALHNPKQGFYIKGWAQDAFNALSEAKVCLSPLRFGAGIKGKFTDAMLARTPSVTTPIGSEAMHGELPWPGQIENNSQDIANAAVRLYKSQETWQQASDRADRVLQTHYNKILLTARLDTALNMLRLTLNVRRRQNFTGAMLRHHQHKSTKYMAQWIAEKNKH